jgi:uridine monophosphate synthetase
MDLLLSLYQNNYIKVGDFTLKSGKKSPLYFDFRSLISNYDLFDRVIDQLIQLIRNSFAHQIFKDDPENFKMALKHKQYLCGIPYGGISFASILNDKFHRETPGWFGLAVARKNRKTHGISGGGYIFGIDVSTEEKPKIILVEDVITTGMSIFETITELEKENCEVVGIISIFDRNESTDDFQFPRDKYPIKSLFASKDILKILEKMNIDERTTIIPYLKKLVPSKTMYLDLLQLVQSKQSNLIVSADNFKNPIDIINYLNVNASKIIMLKLHLDTMVFSDHPNDNQMTEAGFWANIKHLKHKYNFLVMEDAKIADISKIALKKIKRINLYDCVDLITIHGLNAKALLDALPVDYNCPKLAIVCDMSSDTIFNDPELVNLKNIYRQKCFKLSSNQHVLGFITQIPPKNTTCSDGIIYMTPGISITSSNVDDQHYNTPEFAISNGSHLIIVGSGITDYPEFIDDMTSKYQTRGFESYKHKYLSKN